MDTAVAPYQRAAELLGWKWSDAHGGLINERHRNRQGEDPRGWGSYQVAENVENACFFDGLETNLDALQYIANHDEQSI